jgi:hypothetical protein
MAHEPAFGTQDSDSLPFSRFCQLSFHRNLNFEDFLSKLGFCARQFGQHCDGERGAQHGPEACSLCKIAVSGLFVASMFWRLCLARTVSDQRPTNLFLRGWRSIEINDFGCLKGLVRS